MIEYQMLGGNPPSEIGAFQQISEIMQDLRQMQEDIASSSRNSLIFRSTAAGTIFLRDAAARFAPRDTGTLRAAHISETETSADGAIGIVAIHPDVVNPVYHKKPSVYGFDLIDRGYNWHENAMNAYQDQTIEYIATNVLDAAIEIFAG